MKKRIILTLILIMALFTSNAFAASGSNVNSNNSDLTLKVAEKELNGYTYFMKTYNKVKLEWDSVENVDGYKIYKYDSASKKYKLYKTVDENVTSIIVSGLKASKSYSFKICSFKNGKNSSKSEKLTIKTYDKTTGYFYEQVVWEEEWPGVLITDNKASDKEINLFTNLKGINKPVIKFNYSAKNKTLYIHTYVKFFGDALNLKFEDYGYNTETDQFELEKYGSKSYKELVTGAIKKTWGTYVRGSKYDFIPGCNFETKVILHESNLQNQNYLEIHIGNEDCKLNDEYWFYTEDAYYPNENLTAVYYYKSEDLKMVLPTVSMIFDNESGSYSLYTNAEYYENTVAHEFGHVLGLADAYLCYDLNDNKINRTLHIDEINDSSDYSYNLMFDSFDSGINSNDIEMILQAQGMALNNKDFSLQCYNNYKIDDIKYGLSPAIRSAA